MTDDLNSFHRRYGTDALRDAMDHNRRSAGEREPIILDDDLDDALPPAAQPATPGPRIQEAPSARFRLTRFDAIRMGTTPRYVIKGLLASTGLALFWGAPKCGKSFLVLDMLLHVALGRPYRGRRVRQGTVIYCALEGQTGFEARAAAFTKRHLVGHSDPVPFFLMPTPLNLVRDFAELIKDIRAQMPLGEIPTAVCLDTVNRSFDGSESDDAAMTTYVQAADAIREAFGCLVVLIHHCGHDGTRPRGHTALPGAADTQIAVKKTADGVITVTVELQKDGPAGDTFSCQLEAIEVGTDDEGDAITSCVVTPADQPNAPVVKAARRLSPKQCNALAALTEATLNHGAEPPAAFGLPKTIRAIPIDRWRDELHARGVIEQGDKNPRTTLRRIREGLLARHAIGEREGLIWSATSP
ncbi:AAA family ATPase [Methylobacterium nigriterrae]|uniref:AAA family ATPase n=1 Tax=Methylobacterium nigriterrae TaxID=3127512 RepID=UPI0030137E67